MHGQRLEEALDARAVLAQVLPVKVLARVRRVGAQRDRQELHRQAKAPQQVRQVHRPDAARAANAISAARTPFSALHRSRREVDRGASYQLHSTQLMKLSAGSFTMYNVTAREADNLLDNMAARKAEHAHPLIALLTPLGACLVLNSRSAPTLPAMRTAPGMHLLVGHRSRPTQPVPHTAVSGGRTWWRGTGCALPSMYRIRP